MVLVVISMAALLMLIAALASTGMDTDFALDGSVLHSMLSDQVVDDRELERLSGLGCEEIRNIIGTSKNVCIYFRDEDGKLVDFGGKTGFGCPGLIVDGSRVCSQG